MSEPTKSIYMDHAATTPMSPEAMAAMQPYLAERFGNPSTIHAAGQDARRALDEARGRCAAVLGCRPSEIVFTSGGTESDNAGIMGPALALKDRGRHIVTTAIEHHAVLHAAGLLEELGFDLSIVNPDREGIVQPETVAAVLTPETSVVSVMLANNEIGAVQPVAAIAEAVKAKAAGWKRPVAFHTDAVQAAGALSLDVDALGVDLLSLSAHKFGGPKGVGLLYVRRGTPFRPTQVGGAQERDRRAGTENVAGIVSMSVALKQADDAREAASARCLDLRERLLAGLSERVPGITLNGSLEHRLPNNVNVTITGVDAEPLLMGLDLAGIAASSGSACTAASLEPSHVVLALGRSNADSRSTLRLTVGPENTEEEVDSVVDAVAGLVERLRSMSGVKRR